MWIDKAMAEATGKIKDTADEFGVALGELTSDVRAEIREAGELVTMALVVIGTVACAALLIAIAADARGRRG